MLKTKPTFGSTFKWSVVAAVLTALLIGVASGSLRKGLALMTQGNPGHLIGYFAMAGIGLGLVFAILAWPIRLLLWRMNSGENNESAS